MQIFSDPYFPRLLQIHREKLPQSTPKNKLIKLNICNFQKTYRKLKILPEMVISINKWPIYILFQIYVAVYLISSHLILPRLDNIVQHYHSHFIGEKNQGRTIKQVTQSYTRSGAEPGIESKSLESLTFILNTRSSSLCYCQSIQFTPSGVHV